MSNFSAASPTNPTRAATTATTGKLAPIAAEIDTTGLACPIPILKTRQALQTLAAGQLLRVLASDPATAQDFPVFAQQTGHRLLAQACENGRYVFVLCKRTQAPALG